jgi:hypothetical protein
MFVVEYHGDLIGATLGGRLNRAVVCRAENRGFGPSDVSESFNVGHIDHVAAIHLAPYFSGVALYLGRVVLMAVAHHLSPVDESDLVRRSVGLVTRVGANIPSYVSMTSVSPACLHEPMERAISRREEVARQGHAVTAP